MDELKEMLTKQMFGENILYGVAKLYMRRATGGPGTKGMARTLIGGVIVTDDPICSGNDDAVSKNDRMYECEVIIIPRRIYESSTFQRGARIDQILVGGYELPQRYKRQIF
jgi:hypothetical protein